MDYLRVVVYPSAGFGPLHDPVDENLRGTVEVDKVADYYAIC